ncbi:MAG: glycosyltransferase 87 family protein [Myxococcota bacterium]
MGLEGRLRFLRRPGSWFFIVLAFGALLRLGYVFFTHGTLDVDIWLAHAQCIAEQNLIACYADGPYTLNHPPPMGLLAARIYTFSMESGLSFSAVFRLPFAFLDGLTAALLFLAFSRANHERVRNARFVLVALYWANPLAAALASYHGNTDSSIAFFLIAAVLAAHRGSGLLSGALLGLSIWIKLPGILGAPVLFLALKNWKQRVLFIFGFGSVLFLGYGPWLLQDPEEVIRSVMLYQGLMIQTTDGTPIWGLQVFFPFLIDLWPNLKPALLSFLDFYFHWNTLICIIPVVLYAGLRSSENSTEAILQGLAGSYLIFYGFSNLWAFQYLAWSLPFWFMLGPRLALATYLISLAYVYGLYTWLTGSLVLLGDWAFIKKPEWPMALLWLRNLTVWTFFVSACVLIWGALRSALTRWRETGRPLSWL